MIKKGDFIELDYTAKLKDEKLVFDTTSAEVAKATGNFNPKFKYAPVIICVGERQVVEGLDDAIIGKNIGQASVEVSADKGFGKKRADLLKMLPLTLFKRDKVEPYPGLDVNIDGQIGIVKSVSGGRVIVDFNHPLSSKDLSYDIDIKRIVTDPVEKLRSVLNLIGLPHIQIEIEGDTAKVTLNEALPQEIVGALSGDLCRMSGLKEVTFIADAKKNASADAKPKKDEKVHSHSHEGHDHNHEGHDHKHN